MQTIEEATGQERWHVSLGNREQVNAPVLGGGNVALLTSGSGTNSFRTYNLNTGQATSQISSTGTQPAAYSAPLVSSGFVYGQYGDAGGLAKFDPVTASRIWQYNESRRTGGGWAISTDDKLIYNYSEGWMIGVGVTNGRLAYAVASKLPYAGAPATSAPVLSAMQVFVTDSDKTGGALMSFDAASGKLNWLVQANFSSYPALVGDVLYAVNGGKLEARQTSNGGPLWSSPALGGAADDPYTQVLATKNLAFAASSSRVVAVDLATHNVVWQYPAGGKMAISDNGILYITHPVNGVVAINLK